MVRTIISLDPDDKAWLDKAARKAGVPTAELVRRAIRRMRQREQKAFDDLLDNTSGIWRQGDGLRYQRRVRREWR